MAEPVAFVIMCVCMSISNNQTDKYILCVYFCMCSNGLHVFTYGAASSRLGQGLVGVGHHYKMRMFS